MRTFLILLMAVSCVCLAEAAGTYNCSCDGIVCFSAVAESIDYEASLKACRQRSGFLAAVRSRQSSQVIAHLLENVKGAFWIGLRLQDSVCDPSSAMRGYNWATGGNSTDFTNWRDSGSTCAPRCVSVSSDLKWTERPCSGRIDGYICQGELGSTCGRLDEQPNGVALYNTSYHANKALCFVDIGSVAVRVPSGDKYICDGKNWVRAPWSCEVNKGGCDFECAIHDHSPQCVCPRGKAVGGNGVSCEDDLRDPCFSLSCDHYCIPKSGCGCRQGYELAEDGKQCRDIDECSDGRICGDEMCVNTPGSFTCTCPSGFEMSGNQCVDINECLSDPCDHECLNTHGSFNCSCFEGYIKVNEVLCKYHCSQEECPAKCDPNNPAQCYCPEGFIADPRDTETVCVDINECEQNECEQNCVNTYGSYICSCENGYYLEDGFKCMKQDVGVYDFTTPTPSTPGTKTSSVSPGGLFAIIVCVVVMVLLSLLLLHLKINSKWIFRGIRNNNSEDMKNLQQVTAEKDNMPLPDRHLPLNTC